MKRELTHFLSLFQDRANAPGSPPSSPSKKSALSRVTPFFGDIHHIRVKESELDSSLDWITETMARLFIHSRLYQCSRFFGEDLGDLERCPGGCELSKSVTTGRRLVRKRVRKKRISASNRPPVMVGMSRRNSVYARAKSVVH